MTATDKIQENGSRDRTDPRETVAYLYMTYSGLADAFSMKMFRGFNAEDFQDRFWWRIYVMAVKGKFDEVRNEKAFMVGILRHVYWEQLQAKTNQFKSINFEALADIIPSGKDISADMQMLHDEEKMLRERLIRSIVSHVQTMRKPRPEIFEYYYLQGRNTRWIAEKIHINRSTVRGHLMKIRESVKKEFGDSF